MADKRKVADKRSDVGPADLGGLGGLSPDDGGGGGLSPNEWVTEELQKVFEEGLLVDHVFYRGSEPNDRMTQLAVQCFAHEMEQNKFQASTLNNKVEIITRMFQQSKNDWALAKKGMLEILGETKASTVQRWITLARDLDPAVLAHIDSLWPDLNQAYVIGNKYCVGKGEEARYRLSVHYAKIAFDRLVDKLQMNTNISASCFMSDFCAPFKHLQTWEKSQLKTFGAVASKFPAFQRVVRSLTTEAGRQKLLTCVQDRIPLSGLQGKTGGAGIEECRTVVAEMVKMLASASAAAESATAGSGREAGVVVVEDDGGLSPRGGLSPTETKPTDKEEEEELSLENDLMEKGADVDPVLVKARELATQELCHVAVHYTADAFERDIKSRIHSSHRVAVFMEAPTSKAKIFAEFMKIDCFPTRMTLWIPVGSRFDLLPFVLNLVQKKWKDRQAFVITLGGDVQGSRTKSSYAIYLPFSNTDVAPTILSLAGCRAKSSEALRFRCAFEDCKHRRVCTPGTDDGGDDENKDIDEDDLDNMDGDFEAEEEDDQAEEDAVQDGEERIAGEGPKKKRLVNIFPFARPVAMYRRILNDVMKASSLTHLVVLTRSAHPGLFIAGLDCHLEVVAFVGAKPHSIGHGQDILQKLATMRMMKKAQTLVTTKQVRRVSAASVSFIHIQAPLEQPIRMRDIVPDGASWRAGFNKNPVDIEAKVLALLQLDLEEHDLYIAKSTDHSMALFTRVSRKEGDSVCFLRSLLFDSVGRLQSFLSTVGKCLGKRLLKISGC